MSLAVLASVVSMASPAEACYNGGQSQACPVLLPISPPGSFTGDNTGLSTSPGAGQHWNNVTWWTWTPGTTMAIGIRASSLSPGGWDNTLEVWSGGGPTLLVHNDDSYGLDAQVTFTATAGQTYLIGLGSYGGTTGSATLRFFEAPTAPSSVTATAGNASATVTWAMPTANAESVSAYRIFRYINGVQDGGSVTVSGFPPATSRVVTGLVNGTDYTFAVAAVNVVGQGALSAPTSLATPVGTPQAITFTAPATQTTDAAPFMLIASGGGSGNTVTFTSSTPSVCTVAGSTVTLLAAGTCTIAANQAGNTTYVAAPTVTRSFTVVDACTLSLAGGTLPAARLNQPYTASVAATGATATVTYTVTSGALPAGLSVSSSGAISGTATTAASATVTVRADSGSCSVSASYMLNVAAARWITTGADAGGTTHVRSFDTTPAQIAGPLGSFLAEDPSFASGVRVALGDVTGDGVVDVITAAGPGAAPVVRVFRGPDGVLVQSFAAFDPSFTGGLFVAAGDVNDDGIADIVAGTGTGDAPMVRVFNGATGQRLTAAFGEFAPYDAGMRGGVHVAVGDVNGDGRADVITGNGPGGTARVRVWSTGRLDAVEEVTAFDAEDAAFTGGVFVAAGDVNGDGFAEVITGAGPGASPRVKVWDVHNNTVLHSFDAYTAMFGGGVRVAASDIDGDGQADIVTGAGPGGGPHIRVWTAGGGTLQEMTGFFAYAPEFAGGVFVAAPAMAHRMAIDVAAPSTTVAGAVTIVGWALNEAAAANSGGISAIHVWAYPTAGGSPIFAGSTTTTDGRTDVGAAFGGQFAQSGFHLDTTPLAAGTYDFVVYALGTPHVVAQRIVRVTVP